MTMGPSLRTGCHNYVDMVGDLLLGLLRSSRQRDWALHMSTIPWCFGYNKVNYARYLPVYYADMSNMATQYPDIYNNFLDGRFSVQLGSDNPFGKIPVDQTTEETVNKGTKTSGGVRKHSLIPMQFRVSVLLLSTVQPIYTNFII